MASAEATAISFLGPLIAMALAALLLGEIAGPGKVLAAGLAIAGAIPILRPVTRHPIHDAWRGAFRRSGLLHMAGFATVYVVIIFQVMPVWQQSSAPRLSCRAP